MPVGFLEKKRKMCEAPPPTPICPLMTELITTKEKTPIKQIPILLQKSKFFFFTKIAQVL
jgi:hypothetical protein